LSPERPPQWQPGQSVKGHRGRQRFRSRQAAKKGRRGVEAYA
jgi:hypothetical protein